MVGGVPGRIEHVERPEAEGHPLAALDDPDPLGGNRQERTPELVHPVTEHLGRTRQEPGRIDEMGSAPLVDVDQQPRMLGDQQPDGAGVIEVNVGEENGVKIGDPEPASIELGPQSGEGRPGPGIEQHGTGRGIEQVRGHVRFAAQMPDINGHVGHVVEYPHRERT